ncbi:SOS response-associated peptidase [Cucumibacter marinus]|uniref:SOS response-associated peptidase n=1 Tax=Cucumibacter marinus TaxID=1121252 RepID=UPI0003F70A1E|nr:SOS response-associated peptidase [Cucumibacter marinus]
MCPRFALAFPASRLREMTRIDNPLDFPPRYNIAPTQPVVAIRRGPNNGRESLLVRWGLVPGWVKDPSDFPLLINARVESAAEKPSFRDAMSHGRCIIPASGYYEWKKGPGNQKQPFYVHPEDGGFFALAGLMTSWEGPNGEVVDTAAILTQPATGDLAKIHPRTPVALRAHQFDLWLDTANIRKKEALTVVEPIWDLGIVAFPVDRRVGSTRVEGPELIQPIDLDAAGTDGPPPSPKKRAAAAKPAKAAKLDKPAKPSGQGELF